MEYQR